jgi:tetratricopeptide (TPR) repeat protein
VIGNLAVDLTDLGDILRRQHDPGCLPHFQEALTLCQRIGNRLGEAGIAFGLGNTYLSVSGLRDLDQAERWFRHSLGLRAEGDRLGRAQCLAALARVALARSDEAPAAGEAGPVLPGHLNDALRGFHDSLALIPVEDHDSRGAVENDLGNAYLRAGRKYLGEALRHYQRSVQHKEALGDIFGAGRTRFNIAVLLANNGRTGDALHFARAALDNLLSSGPGAAAAAGLARQLIAGLE